MRRGYGTWLPQLRRKQCRRAAKEVGTFLARYLIPKNPQTFLGSDQAFAEYREVSRLLLYARIRVAKTMPPGRAGNRGLPRENPGHIALDPLW